MKLVYNFCSSVYSLTIINLYVHLLPVTEGRQNNKKKSTSNTITQKKNQEKEDDAWANDENIPTEQEKKRKKMIQGKMMMTLSLTVFKLNLSIHLCLCKFCTFH